MSGSIRMGQYERFHLPGDEQFDEVIARVSNLQIQSQLTASKLPVVNVSAIQSEKGVFLLVCINQEASASLVLDHFKSSAIYP